MYRLTLGALMLLISLLFACSSPEKETKRWNELQAKQKTIVATYPQWQPVFNSDMNTATKMWNTAQNITDSKAQVKAMKAANDYLNAIPSKLEEIETKIDSNNRQKRELNKLKLGGVQNDKRNRAISAINTTNEQVQTAIKQSPKATHEEALLFLGTQTKRLINISSNNRRFIKHFKRKKRRVKSSKTKRPRPQKKSTSKRKKK
jgi:hypothetical protein